jgi:hypothetical protein
MAILVAAAAAALAANATGAFGQEACSKGYVSCLEACLKQPSKGLQDQCMTSCQGQNNQCAEKVYGARHEVGPPNLPAREDKKALAKEAAPSPPPRKVDVAPRKGEGLRKVDLPPRRRLEAPAPAEPAPAAPRK